MTPVEIGLISAIVFLTAVIAWLIVRMTRMEQQLEEGKSHLEEKALADLERKLTRKLKRMEQLIDRASELDLKRLENGGNPPNSDPDRPRLPQRDNNHERQQRIQDSVPDFDPRERYSRLRSELHRQIALQLDLGRDETEIAQEYDVGVGEVELVKNLLDL